MSPYRAVTHLTTIFTRETHEAGPENCRRNFPRARCGSIGWQFRLVTFFKADMQQARKSPAINVRDPDMRTRMHSANRLAISHGTQKPCTHIFSVSSFLLSSPWSLEPTMGPGISSTDLVFGHSLVFSYNSRDGFSLVYSRLGLVRRHWSPGPASCGRRTDCVSAHEVSLRCSSRCQISSLAKRNVGTSRSLRE